MAKSLRDPASIGVKEFTSSFDPITAMNLYGAKKIKAAEADATAKETKRATSYDTLLKAKEITTKLDTDRLNSIVPMQEAFLKENTGYLVAQNGILTPAQQLKASSDLTLMKGKAAILTAQGESILKRIEYINEHQDKVKYEESMDYIDIVTDPKSWLSEAKNQSKDIYSEVSEAWTKSGENIAQFREQNPQFGVVYKPKEVAEGVFDIDAYVGTTLANLVYTPDISSKIEKGDITTDYALKATLDTQIDKVLGDWYDYGVTSKGYDAKGEVRNRWELAKTANNSEAIAAKDARTWFIENYKPKIRKKKESFAQTTDETKGDGTKTKANHTSKTGNTIKISTFGTLPIDDEWNYSSATSTQKDITTSVGYYFDETGQIISPSDFPSPSLEFKTSNIVRVKKGSAELTFVTATTKIGSKERTVYVPYNGVIKETLLSNITGVEDAPENPFKTYAEMFSYLTTGTTTTNKAPGP